MSSPSKRDFYYDPRSESLVKASQALMAESKRETQVTEVLEKHLSKQAKKGHLYIVTVRIPDNDIAIYRTLTREFSEIRLASLNGTAQSNSWLGIAHDMKLAAQAVNQLVEKCAATHNCLLVAHIFEAEYYDSISVGKPLIQGPEMLIDDEKVHEEKDDS